MKIVAVASAALALFAIIFLVVYRAAINDRREQCVETCGLLGDRFVFVNDYGCACSEHDPMFTDPENRWIRLHPRGY